MTEAPTAPPRGPEVEIGGAGLIALALAVLGLCAGAFWLGRRTAPAAASGPARSAMEDEGDLAEDLTFFDRLEHAPELSAQGPPAAAQTPGEAAPRPSPGEGPFHVQVLATGERAAAEAIAARLRERGYPVQLAAGQRAGETIYRVRVGGYRDEAKARAVASEIEKRDGLRTWVTR